MFSGWNARMRGIATVSRSLLWLHLRHIKCILSLLVLGSTDTMIPHVIISVFHPRTFLSAGAVGVVPL